MHETTVWQLQQLQHRQRHWQQLVIALQVGIAISTDLRKLFVP
jgi:hypothetical protein